MQLYNFQADEVDSIYTYSYKKGSNFTQVLDSSLDHGALSGDNTSFSVWLSTYDSDFDYLIKIKGWTGEYRITDLNTEKRKCNACVPFAPKSEYFSTLIDYQLNGQHKNDFIIDVFK
jgi:hypothetical protein